MSSRMQIRSKLHRLLVGAVLLPASIATAQEEYFVIDLGSIDAGMSLPLSDWDNIGVRLNNITGPGIDPSFQLPAVQVATMSDGQGLLSSVRIVNGQMTPLGTLGGAETIVHGVNFYPNDPTHNVRIVGASQDVDSFFRAFIWDGVIAPTDLGTLGGDESSALAINDIREIVGWAQDGFGEVHATLWEGVIAPTDLNAAVSGTGPSVARDIDNFGHIVGQASYTGLAQATAWICGSSGCTALGLGALGGDESEALAAVVAPTEVGALPTQMIAAGWAEVTPGGARHAAMWSVDTITEVIAPTDLGTLGGTNAAALDVTNLDNVVAPTEIVGWSDLEGLSARSGIRSSRQKTAAGNIVTHAFIWDATNGMRDLNDLIDPNSGWELTRANALNSSGMISGIGLVNGDWHAYRLEPLNPPQPCPSDSNHDGSVTVVDLLDLLGTWGACP